METQEETKSPETKTVIQLNTKTNRPYILLGILGIVLIIFLGSAFSGYGKDYVTEIIQEFVDKEVKQIKDEYETSIKAKDEQIAQFLQLLNESDETINTLKKRLTNVEYKIKNRQAPQTNSEIRNRFANLNLTPVN